MSKSLRPPGGRVEPPTGDGGGLNRLAGEKSPYLLQHASNPVDWYPWGDDAFEKAAREDKPVFLSIGYSTCHWCHVMARESFQRDDVAEALNRDFISIKVDREERPDVDDVYMQATQLLTGRGGWPNSVWLTPDKRPWYAGTYFPREDHPGQPGFLTVLKALSDLWRTRRADVEAQAEQLAESVRQVAAAPEELARPKGPFSRLVVDEALAELHRAFDSRFAGFGGAPKFPPHADLRLIFYENSERPNMHLLTMATRTLEAISAGGIHDHVGGGFHRYSTDLRWFLPHFEKMLYDNALLARAYVDAWLATGDDHFRRTAAGTIDWVLREMTGEEGGFHSALDAETGGEEGAYYLWTRAEIMEVLGEEEGAFLADLHGVREEGNFRDESTGEKTGANVLYLPEQLASVARRERVSVAYLADRLEKDRVEMLKARDGRTRPGVDDKVLASWNGLIIGSLAYAGRETAQVRYIDAARRAAGFISERMRVNGRLVHSYRDGRTDDDSFLEDYAYLAWGFLDLHDATGDQRWLDHARELADVIISDFADAERGGFYFTRAGRPRLITRMKDAYDRALPSANGIAAQVLVRLARATGRDLYLDHARSTLKAFLGAMQAASRATPSLILAADMYLDSTGQGPEGIREPRVAADVEPDARASGEHVKVDAYADRAAAAPGRTLEVAFRLEIEEGWHVNSARPTQDYLTPTTVTFDENRAAEAAPAHYPEGAVAALGFSDEPLSVYVGTVWMRAQVRVRDDAEGGHAPLVFHVRVQPCSRSECLAVETLSLMLPLEVRPDAPEEPSRHREVFERMPC